jgi:signal peptidase I
MNSDEHNHYSPLNLLSNDPPKKKPKNGITTALSSLSVFIFIPVLIALFLTAFVIQSYQVDGESMQNTLQNHDRLIVNKLSRTWSRLTGHAYVPKRGDIIVFNQTGLPDSIYQKQLIAGKYHIDATYTATNGPPEITLGDNEIFVCGDNRSNSEDSRYFGPVSVNNVVGHLILRIMPLDKAETF